MGRAAIVALAALLVVDVALVALALRHVQASDFGETVAAPSSGGDGQQDQNAQGGDQGGSAQDQQPTKAPEMLINIGEGGAVGRAVAGSCQDGGAKVELSTDGGSTWTNVTPELDVVARVSVTNADEMTVVGSTSECESVVAYTTTNGGGVWEETDQTTWHTALDGGSSIYSPYGEAVSVPCAQGDGVSAVSIISSVIALCEDGTVQTTADSGESWEHAGDVPGATALDFTSDSTGLAVVPGGQGEGGQGGEGCAGVAVMRTEDGGATWSQSGCLRTDQTGQAHISASGESAYVALGTSTWSTSDGGASWSPVGE